MRAKIGVEVVYKIQVAGDVGLTYFFLELQPAVAVNGLFLT